MGSKATSQKDLTEYDMPKSPEKKGETGERGEERRGGKGRGVEREIEYE